MIKYLFIPLMIPLTRGLFELPEEPSGPSAELSNTSFNDATDTATFTTSTPGTLYWAIAPIANSPSKSQIIAGTGGGIIEAGNEEVTGTDSFSPNYTDASGLNGETRKLLYLVVPTDTEISSSNIVFVTFALNLGPDAFETSHWSVANEGSGGTIVIAVTSLPEDNGYAITDLEYRLDGGSWVSLGGATTGNYEVSGLTDDQEYDVQIRAIAGSVLGIASGIKSITPTTIVSATIYNTSFYDPTDTATFAVDYQGVMYWAISLTADSPSESEIIAGTGGGILEAGSVSITGTGVFDDDYTNAAGAHGDTRRLSYLLDPTASGIGNSNIVRVDFTLDLAPDAFTAGDWDVADPQTDGDVSIVITALPNNNGYAITDLEYRADGGSWTSLGGNTATTYVVSGLTNDQEYDIEIRAVNAEGNGATSDIKTVTPTAPATWASSLVARWDANLGVVAEGTGLTTWTDQVGSLVLEPTSGNVEFLATGGANENPVIYLPSGGALTESIVGSDIPVGGADRTLIIVAGLPTGVVTANNIAAPSWGTNATSQAFGIGFNTNERAVADYWGSNTASTTNFADTNLRVVSTTLASQVARIYVNGALEATSGTLTLNTASNIIRVGRDLANSSRSALWISAIYIFDTALSDADREAAEAYLTNTYLL